MGEGSLSTKKQGATKELGGQPRNQGNPGLLDNHKNKGQLRTTGACRGTEGTTGTMKNQGFKKTGNQLNRGTAGTRGKQPGIQGNREPTKQ
jgi:hypothetical protein